MKDHSYFDERWTLIHLDDINLQGVYQISNYGRIRRFKKDIQEHKILAAHLVNGYYYMGLRSPNNYRQRKTKSIHRLVAINFLPVPTNKDRTFVIHIDHNKTNNYYKNLKWVSQAELTEHNRHNPNFINSIRKGVITNSKLDVKDVIRLKKKLKRGKNKLYKLAREFGITHTQLNRIRSGENWGHVKVDDED